MTQKLDLETVQPKEEAKSADDTAFSLEGAAASSVKTVGTSDPAGDFEGLMRDGKADVAFNSLPQAVFTLVDNSLGERCDCLHHALHAVVEYWRVFLWRCIEAWMYNEFGKLHGILNDGHLILSSFFSA